MTPVKWNCVFANENSPQVALKCKDIFYLTVSFFFSIGMWLKLPVVHPEHLNQITSFYKGTFLNQEKKDWKWFLLCLCLRKSSEPSHTKNYQNKVTLHKNIFWMSRVTEHPWRPLQAFLVVPSKETAFWSTNQNYIKTHSADSNLKVCHDVHLKIRGLLVSAGLKDKFTNPGNGVTGILQISTTN